MAKMFYFMLSLDDGYDGIDIFLVFNFEDLKKEKK